MRDSFQSCPSNVQNPLVPRGDGISSVHLKIYLRGFTGFRTFESIWTKPLDDLLDAIQAQTGRQQGPGKRERNERNEANQGEIDVE